MRMSLFGLSTNFYEIEGDLKHRLVLEEERGMHKLPDINDAENEKLEDMYKANYNNNATLQEKRKEWLDKILSKLPEGCQVPSHRSCFSAVGVWLFFLFRRARCVCECACACVCVSVCVCVCVCVFVCVCV